MCHAWSAMPGLSSNSRAKLLDLARASIRSHFEGGPVPVVDPADAGLAVKRGCFVTLRKKGALRGCVGTFDIAKPLAENVLRLATAAAFQDTRFPPLQKSELAEVRIEISVLGELRKMNSIEEIEIGRHGVFVRLGNRSGTFLPEVAVSEKWSREEFLAYCARQKAGLSPEEIGRAEVFLYEVEKFEEDGI